MLGYALHSGISGCGRPIKTWFDGIQEDIKVLYLLERLHIVGKMVKAGKRSKL